jgi:hypothetical protein
MRKITSVVLLLLVTSFTTQSYAQDDRSQRRIKTLEQQKTEIAKQEKKALKEEVKSINERLENGSVTEAEAKILKEEAARKRAMNIEDRVAILENQIALLKRNDGEVMELDTLDYKTQFLIGFGTNDEEDDRIFGIRFRENPRKRFVKYDRRTYSDFVIAIGLNNALIEGQSLDDSPYKIGGSRFFEMGWQWRTRVFQNSNWLRFNYGFSFQFNGLKPDNNQYFVQNGNQTELQEFDVPLDKSKLRMDNLVFPIHFEFGPSRFYETEEKIRYSLRRQFRMGIGGYGGFNIGTRQKLKYNRNGEDVKDKLKRDYNTSNLIYGLSAYAGFDNTLLYVKYDLNPIFKDAAIEQRNISLGLRFDLD